MPPSEKGKNMPRNTVPELPDFDIEFEEGFFETLDEEFADHGLEAVLDGPDPDPEEDEDPDPYEDDDWFDVREDDYDAFDLNDDGEHDWN
tara:strand:+ start:82 stop:351 length:270 start_codon:yes stop_codon:yes gene_type:complete